MSNLLVLNAMIKRSFFILFYLFYNYSFAATRDLGPVKRLFRVDKIEVKGLKRVEKEAILEKSPIKKRRYVTNYKVREFLKRIYSLKYFSSIEAHHIKRNKKNILLIKLKEKPVVSNIIFKGNDELSDDDIIAIFKTKKFSILDINTIKSDIKALLKEYETKGYYLVKIDYKLKKINEENVELIIDIKEANKVRVKNITFLGNRFFTDKQLKDIMNTQEEDLFSFMSDAGNFKEFDFRTDLERLKYFYKTKGYLQVNIGRPEVTISADKRWIFITIKINEGSQFKVNNIYFVGDNLFSEEELLNKIILKKDNIYSEDILRRDIQLLTELYQDKGYAFVNVLRTLRIIPGENKVDVEFSFEKGQIAYFGKVIIKGNNKTRDKVILRELKIIEGSKFSGSALRISKQNVARLEFFERNGVIFNTILSKDKDNVVDIEITVKERANTGQITAGAGYSTATGGFINASVSQKNFRGLGQTLSFGLSWSKTQKTFNIGFTEPYLFDTDWTIGGDLFRTLNESSNNFVYRKEGVAIRVGYPIFDYTRLYVTYRYENTHIKSSDDPTIDEDIENGIASSIRLALVRDTRDNRMEPAKGYYFNASTQYTGVGGDKEWRKHELDGRYFRRLYRDFIFRSRLYVGKLNTVDGKPISRSEKFSLGGPRNLRGYPIHSIGPKQSININGVDTEINLRSTFATFATFEVEHPLAQEAGLKWVIFFDLGDANDEDNLKLYRDYGYGLRWFSPIGVLRFEFGYPLDGEYKGSQFYFDIGQLF